MTRNRLLAVLRSLRPEDHAAGADYARRVRLKWRISSPPSSVALTFGR